MMMVMSIQVLVKSSRVGHHLPCEALINYNINLL